MKRKTSPCLAEYMVDSTGASKLFRTNLNISAQYMNVPRKSDSDVQLLGVSLEMLTLAQLRNKFAANPLNVDLDGDNSHRCSESNCCECELVYTDSMRICQYMRGSIAGQ